MIAVQFWTEQRGLCLEELYQASRYWFRAVWERDPKPNEVARLEVKMREIIDELGAARCKPTAVSNTATSASSSPIGLMTIEDILLRRGASLAIVSSG